MGVFIIFNNHVCFLSRQKCCSHCGNMKYVPPVIYWVGRHRRPADCAGLGCRCRTVPLWSGSPPVRSQQGRRNKQFRAAVCKNGTWRTTVLKANAQNDKLQSLLLPPSSQSAVHVCWLWASFCLFPVPSPRMTQLQ